MQQLEAAERSADTTLAVTPAALQQQIDAALQEGVRPAVPGLPDSRQL